MLAAARGAEEAGADLIEVRLDWLSNLTKSSIAKIFTSLSDSNMPTIATIMPKSLFGKFPGNDSERVDLLLEAANYADYIDVGMEIEGSLRASLVEKLIGKAEVLLSMHSDHLLNKREIASVVRAEGKKNIIKIAMPAMGWQDNLVALDACSSLDGYKRIIFCYGKVGKISRVLSPFFGSEWTYASLGIGKEAAPGQIDIKSVRLLQEAFL